MYKFVSILLSLLYFCAFSGATVTVHYCAGTVASVSFNEIVQEKSCPKCEKKQKTCCQDKQAFLKVNSKHEPTLQQTTFAKLKFVETNNKPFVFPAWKLTAYYLSHLHKKEKESPPFPLYIANCVYRI